MNDIMLDIKNLTIHYSTEGGVVHAVEGLNLTVGRGESLGFVGETGAGKSVLMGALELVLAHRRQWEQAGHVD